MTVALSTEVVQDVLRELELRYFLDSDGDIVSFWEGFRVYFFLYGEQTEILQQRAYLEQSFTLDEKPLLLDRLDEWNRTRLLPKVYTVVEDDGSVTVRAENTLDTEPGVSRDMLTFTIRSWVASTVRFVEWFRQGPVAPP